MSFETNLFGAVFFKFYSSVGVPAKARFMETDFEKTERSRSLEIGIPP